jgi:hypothetical protein
MSRSRQKARVLEFQLARPSDKSANRTFIALLGRRMRPRDSGRLQRLSLAATGLPKRFLEAANILAIRTAFDLALAWPWQIDRLAATGCSRPRLAAVLLAALDGALVPRPALPVRDEEAEILAMMHSFRDSAGNRPRRRSSATAAPSAPGSKRKPRRRSGRSKT